MPTFYFLKIGLRPGSGIVGHSLNPDHPGWMEIETWAPGPLKARQNNSGGGSGKFRTEQFSFSKRVDGSSARLFNAWHAGDNFDGAVLAIEGPGTPQLFQFENIQIADFDNSIMHSVTDFDVRAEAFAIGFAEMRHIVGATSAAGYFGPPARRTGKATLTAAALAVATALAPSSAPAVSEALRRFAR